MALTHICSTGAQSFQLSFKPADPAWPHQSILLSGTIAPAYPEPEAWALSLEASQAIPVKAAEVVGKLLRQEGLQNSAQPLRAALRHLDARAAQILNVGPCPNQALGIESGERACCCGVLLQADAEVLWMGEMNKGLPQKGLTETGMLACAQSHWPHGCMVLPALLHALQPHPGKYHLCCTFMSHLACTGG